MPLVAAEFKTATDPARIAFGGGSFAGGWRQRVKGIASGCRQGRRPLLMWHGAQQLGGCPARSGEPGRSSSAHFSTQPSHCKQREP